MNKRHRMAQIIADTLGLDWHASHEFRQRCLAAVDAILAELREPDDRMIDAARHWAVGETEKAFWQAMIDAISEDTKPPEPREDDLTEKQRKATLKRAPLASWFG